MTPTLNLTNASSKRLHRGHTYNIMAAPRRWERFEGNVPMLTPHLVDLRAVRAGEITPEEYRERYEALVAAQAIRLGALLAWQPGWERVADGDTLVCACSRTAAAEGRCHRAWAAPFLVRAGWRVVLDGVEVPA